MAAGMVVGRYELLETLGAGGFGEVWRARAIGARDDEPGIVAVKFATRPEARAALVREGAIQSKLAHPGIVRVIDQDLAATPPYVVLEYCAGGSLRGLLRGAFSLVPQAHGNEHAARWSVGLGAERALKPMFQQIAVALAHAHSFGVTHGDLKPENILFDAQGHPKITDFGLGTTRAGGSVELSKSLASVDLGGGTLAYLPPERHTGARPDAAGDVWAFGVMLFEATHGRLPEGSEDAGWPMDWVFEACYVPRRKRLKDGPALLSTMIVGPRLHGLVRSGPPTPLLRKPRLRFVAALAVALLAGVLIGSGRASRADALAPGPRPPAQPRVRMMRAFLEEVRAAAALVAIDQPYGAQPGLVEAVDRLQTEAEADLGYRITPDLQARNVRAEPRYAGWPAYVLDARGNFGVMEQTR